MPKVNSSKRRRRSQAASHSEESHPQNEDHENRRKQATRSNSKQSTLKKLENAAQVAINQVQLTGANDADSHSARSHRTRSRSRKTAGNPAMLTNEDVASKKSTSKESKREKKKFSPERLLEWFHELAVDESGTSQKSIGPSGIEKLAKQINKDVTDVGFIVISWMMKAKDMCYFTEAEWMKGMIVLEVDSAQKLKKKWESLNDVLEINLKDIYRFCYDFSKEDDKRHLDISLAKELITLLLGKRWSLCGKFCEYLDTLNYKVINRDQYQNILEFYLQVQSDCSDYDMNGAWPVLLDEFVASIKAGQGAAPASK